MFTLLLACAQTDGELSTDTPGSDDTGRLAYPAGAWVIDHVTVVDADGARPDRAVIIDSGQILSLIHI